MGMTMTQKILARHAGLEHVVPGQLVEGKLDLVLGNDITTPVAIAEFNKAGLTQVFDREKIALVLDHYTPCKDIKAAQLCAQVREFAKRFDITHFYDVGCMGVEHALLPEQGLTAPGEAMIGADSHTPVRGVVPLPLAEVDAAGQLRDHPGQPRGGRRVRRGGLCGGSPQALMEV